MPASTYPNHATFVTGVAPGAHGLWSSLIPSPTDGPAPAGTHPPLFDAWEEWGRRCPPSSRSRSWGWACAAPPFSGTQHLVGVMGAGSADWCWPAKGELGDEVAKDALGYADDGATAEQIAEAVGRRPDLVVAQLNGPDTAAHLYGPDSDEALEAYRYTDAAIATVRQALAPHWDDWVVLVVSDHSQEEASDEAIDLDAAIKARGVDARIIRDGSAAIVTGQGGADPRWLDDVDAVVGVEPLADDTVVVWGRPGSSFGEHPLGCARHSRQSPDRSPGGGAGRRPRRGGLPGRMGGDDGAAGHVVGPGHRPAARAADRRRHPPAGHARRPPRLGRHRPYIWSGAAIPSSPRPSASTRAVRSQRPRRLWRSSSVGAFRTGQFS